jgi:ATP-dependent DNA helicase RecQ
LPCITFYSYKDIQKLEKFMQGKPIAEQEIGKQLLMETVAYAESNSCGRKLLLNYFGEDYHTENCGACDKCLHPKKTFDGREEMAMVIELIQNLPENFKTEHLANILAGEINSIIKSYKHDKIDLFGAGKDHSVRFWSAVIHQGLVMHLLHKDIESYGLISATQAGLEFFAEPYELILTEDREFAEGEDDDDDIAASAAAARGGGGGDERLLAMLKDLRRDVARKLNLQPWVIFGDPSLEDMSIMYPITIDELKNCQGVGEGKARKFGGEFLKLIEKYVEENEIIRPDDFVMKSIVNKSVNKVFIIQSVDRKLPLEDIADAKGMDMEELLDEIEAIVYSGTKLNLDYYIEQTLDEDIVEDIYDYFHEDAQSDSLKEAMEELGGDYDEQEVRLVRIKFLCEVAN